MANRSVGAGLSFEVALKIAANRDPGLELVVLEWIKAVLNENLPPGPIEEVLKDGTVLCRLMNKLKPGSIPKVHTNGKKFKIMENMENFQKAIKNYGVPEVDVFQTVDLYEKRNIPQVVHSIRSLGRACYLHPEWTGPLLGPKPAEENKRIFTEKQLRAGQGFNGFY